MEKLGEEISEGRKEISYVISKTVSYFSVFVSLSLSFSLPYICGFFRDLYLRPGALGAEPETESLVQMIFEGELSQKTPLQNGENQDGTGGVWQRCCSS